MKNNVNTPCIKFIKIEIDQVRFGNSTCEKSLFTLIHHLQVRNDGLGNFLTDIHEFY